MAGPYYLRSTDGSDADTGLTWALAKASLTTASTGAFAVMAAGERCWVSQAHAGTTAGSVSITSPGTTATPCEVFCGNDGAEPPTSAATTATVATTGGSSMTFTGAALFDGITFNCGSGSSAAAFNFGSGANAFWFKLKNGKLKLGSTNGTTTKFNVGVANSTSKDCLVELSDTNVQFSNSGQGIVPRAKFVWHGGALDATGTAPTILFLPPASGQTADADVRGVDLSFLGSGSLVDLSQTQTFHAYFENCKLHASTTPGSGTPVGHSGSSITMVNCWNDGTQNYFFQQNYVGTETRETTIVRSGGSSDGTTSYSHKIVTTANSKFYASYRTLPLGEYWFDSTGSVTVSVEVVNDGTTLNNADIWVEAEYLATSGSTQSTLGSGAAASIVASTTNWPTSSETWTTTGLASPVKQTVSVTFTVGQKGRIIPRLHVARASLTVYADAKILSGSGRQYLVSGGSTVNEAAASAAGVNRAVCPSGVTYMG